MVADDEAVMRAAVEQGVPISQIKRRSAVSRDIEVLRSGMIAALGLEH
jgi:pilus assembly protein CpaE